VIRVFERGAALELPLPRASRVAVKPNLTATRHRPGVTTSPEVLERVLRLLLDNSNRVTVVESDGGYGAWRCEQALEGHGIPDMCRRLGVGVVNLSASPSVGLPVRAGQGEDVVIPFPALLADSTDAFITMPVPKVHCMTGVSLAMKNQWGLIPDPLRLHYHYLFDAAILEINRRLPAARAVVDGTWFLDGGGPLDGNPLAKGLVIAADGIGECDRYLCALMGVDPLSIPHLRHAIAAGFVPGDLSAVAHDPDVLHRHRYQAVLRRTPRQSVVRVFFHSRRLTRLMYTSWFGRAVHAVFYRLVGRPVA
jgi:uncharacterized protein (DUF362 family)